MIPMKLVRRILLLTAIIAVTAISAQYAARLYREKYAPRYLKGNAG